MVDGFLTTKVFHLSHEVIIHDEDNVSHSYHAHNALLDKTSGYFHALLTRQLAQDPLSEIFPPEVHPWTFGAYLQWLYTGRVPYDDQLLTTYMSSEKLRAPAFGNAIIDTLVATIKKDPNLLPKAVQLKRLICDQKSKDSKIRKLMIDLLIWEVDPTKRNGILGNFDAKFEEEEWKKCEEKKDDPAPHSDGLQSYYEDVWDYGPLNAAPEEIAPRLEKL
jgi:hypothetical protein